MPTWGSNPRLADDRWLCYSRVVGPPWRGSWVDGPLWLYVSPGSGVWLDAGRRVLVTRNLADAVLRLRPLAAVAAALEAACAAELRLAQWRVAFGAAAWR